MAQAEITNFFRYFAAGPREDAWGFHVSALGHTRIPARKPYPPQGHPAGRNFAWQTGRTLPAMQLVWISSGRGVLEWRDQKESIERGTVFLLLPGQWHRYRPAPETGWTEDWFELRGPIVARWTEAGLFSRRVFRVAEPAEISRRFRELHGLNSSTSVRPPGRLAGLAMSLLATVSQAPSGKNIQLNRAGQKLVAEARDLLSAGLTVNQVARKLGVSYPTLHRVFSRLVGLAPKGYAQEIRRARAESLLAGGLLSIKEIAAELGYHSAAHFSLSFKRACGISPQHWQQQWKPPDPADGSLKQVLLRATGRTSTG